MVGRECCGGRGNNGVGASVARLIPRGLRRGNTKWDLEKRAVARQTRLCGSEQGVVLCGLAGAWWAEGLRRLVDALLAQ